MFEKYGIDDHPEMVEYFYNQNMQAIIIVMLLTYTSLYKIITISLKTIGWRQLVKPSRYRNTIYTYQ